MDEAYDMFLRRPFSALTALLVAVCLAMAGCGQPPDLQDGVDDTGDEPLYDEALCPVDSAAGVIVDDELRARFAAVPDGKPIGHMMPLLRSLVEDHRAELMAISNVPAILDLARVPLALPDHLPEWISPLVSIIPGQLFCYHLTRAMGYDTETPRQLSKITRTW